MSTTHCSEPSCSIRAQRSLDTKQFSDFKSKAAALLVQAALTRKQSSYFWTSGTSRVPADCIHQMAPELFVQGTGGHIQAWLGRLPDEFVETERFGLCIGKASCRMGHAPAESLLLLQRSFEHLRIAGDVPGVYMSWAGIVAAAVYSGNDFYCLREVARRVRPASRRDSGPAPSPFVDFIVDYRPAASAYFQSIRHAKGA